MKGGAQIKGGENTTRLSFRFERATKNMYRFREDNDEPIVGTLYVSKRAFSGGAPDKIEVTIEW